MWQIFKLSLIVFFLGGFNGYAQSGQDLKPTPTVAMNFHDVDVDSVLRFFGEATGTTIVKDPSLTEKISITTFENATVDEALQILNSVLTVKGYTLVKTGNVWKIVPLQQVAKTNVGVIKDYSMDKAKTPSNDTVLTKMIFLQHAAAGDVAEAIRPLIGGFGSVIAYARTNTVIVTDTSANLERVTALIDDLDRQKTSLITKSYEIHYAQLDHMVETLKNIMSQYEKELGHIEINADERTRSVFVTTVPENFDRVEALIRQMDTGIPQVIVAMELIRIPYRSIDVDIRHRLLDEDVRKEGDTVVNAGDQLFHWRYGLNTDPNKMFSWYGYSADKSVSDFMRKLNALFGPDYFEVYTLPSLSLANNTASQVSFGKESYFAQLAPISIDFKMIPHVNEDNTVTLELNQAVCGDTVRAQEAYARFVLNDGQTAVLGGLNELKQGQVAKDAASYREGATYVSNEFLILLTPHVVLDPESFKKKIDAQKKEAELLRQKPDLSLLFPDGFVEVTDNEKTQGAVNPDIIQTGDYNPASAILGPLPEKQASQIWWKMRDMVKLPDPEIEVTGEGSDRAFVAREIEAKRQHATDESLQDVAVEEQLNREPDLSSQMPAVAAEQDGYVLKETLYRRGIDFYKKGQYKGAIREFAPLVSVDPHYKNVQRYMQLAQQRYRQSMQENEDQQAIDAKLRDKKIKDLTQVDASMDQKKRQLEDKEAMGSYTNTDTIFPYEGDPARIPEDRIEKVSADRLSGELLEVSATHPLVVVNRGSVHKILPGMMFKVYRDGELIGKVRISDVGDQVSGAEIESRKTPDMVFRMGDKVVQA